MIEQLTLFDAPARVNIGAVPCRRCKQPTDDPHTLCPACLKQCPSKRVGGKVIYLTAPIEPANWQDIEPWKSDYRNGARSGYPGYYRDADGVIWEYVFGGMGRYTRWQ